MITASQKTIGEDEVEEWKLSQGSRNAAAIMAIDTMLTKKKKLECGKSRERKRENPRET